jgi:hypothetical protein
MHEVGKAILKERDKFSASSFEEASLIKEVRRWMGSSSEPMER